MSEVVAQIDLVYTMEEWNNLKITEMPRKSSSLNYE